MLDYSNMLTSELWNQVFLHLCTDQWRPGNHGLTKQDVDLYPHLHRLKLVCKKFNDVFQEQHDLFGIVLLRQNLEPDALPGLLACLHRQE